MFVHPTLMKHTQLFANLLLLVTKEWPHSESKSTLGQAEMFYPLCLFRHIYPNCIDKTGHPAGFIVSNTRLTAYNGTWIPLFGSLHGTITWQPGFLSAQCTRLNSCWHVVDTSGPAILGAPSCKRLEVVKMSCAVKVIQCTL